MGRKKRRAGLNLRSASSTKDAAESVSDTSKKLEVSSTDIGSASSSREGVTLDASSTNVPGCITKKMNPLAKPFTVSPDPNAGPSRSVALSSVASNILDTRAGASSFPIWKKREQLLPSTSGEPNVMQPRITLNKKIVILEDREFKKAIQALPPYTAALYKDARESRDGSYCYEVADGMRMIALINKMIFPLTSYKLSERYVDDKMMYPMNTILVMEATRYGNMEPVQYFQVYLENDDKVHVPTGVYQKANNTPPGFYRVYNREEWNEFRSRCIDMDRTFRETNK